MADKIAKFLKQLTKKDQSVLIVIIQDIIENNLEKYDLKRLVGYRDIYRVRKGKYRIVFKKNNQDIEILEVQRRRESTYKEY